MQPYNERLYGGRIRKTNQCENLTAETLFPGRRGRVKRGENWRMAFNFHSYTDTIPHLFYFERSSSLHQLVRFK